MLPLVNLLKRPAPRFIFTGYTTGADFVQRSSIVQRGARWRHRCKHRLAGVSGRSSATDRETKSPGSNRVKNTIRNEEEIGMRRQLGLTQLATAWNRFLRGTNDPAYILSCSRLIFHRQLTHLLPITIYTSDYEINYQHEYLRVFEMYLQSLPFECWIFPVGTFRVDGIFCLSKGRWIMLIPTTN